MKCCNKMKIYPFETFYAGIFSKKGGIDLLNINVRLRELRIKFGYTQIQIAKMLNIDRSTYAYYETGKTRPDITSLVVLARIYNISLDELLDDESMPKAVSDHRFVSDYVEGKKNSSRIYDLSAKEKSLVGAYRTCSEEEQANILEYISRIIKEHGGPPRVH